MKRREAMAAGLKFYSTGKPCKYGHFSERYVSGSCFTCQRLYEAEHAKEISNRRRKLYIKNKIKENTYLKEWNRIHASKKNALTAKRRAKRLNACPSWVSKEQTLTMEGYYNLARTLTVLTGKAHVVDHFYPLQGKTCSGLHVPWNLRVITAKENSEKHNKIPETT